MAATALFAAAVALVAFAGFPCDVSGKVRNASDYFTLCRRDDPNLSDCVRNSILAAKPSLAKGIPDLRIPSLEPLFITELESEEGAGNLKLHQKLSNLTINGLSAFEIKECRFPADLSRLYLDMQTPNIFFEGRYEMTGRILALPISGSGNCFLNFTSVRTIADVPLKRVERNGKEYLTADDFIWTIDAETGKVHFDNLFNGDKALGETMNKFLNENWKDAFQTYKHLPEEAFGVIFKDIGNHVFELFTVDEILPK